MAVIGHMLNTHDDSMSISKADGEAFGYRRAKFDAFTTKYTIPSDDSSAPGQPASLF